jgi:hypothetical protein
MNIENLEREFVYNGLRLGNPSSNLTVQEVSRYVSTSSGLLADQGYALELLQRIAKVIRR